MILGYILKDNAVGKDLLITLKMGSAELCYHHTIYYLNIMFRALGGYVESAGAQPFTLEDYTLPRITVYMLRNDAFYDLYWFYRGGIRTSRNRHGTKGIYLILSKLYANCPSGNRFRSGIHNRFFVNMAVDISPHVGNSIKGTVLNKVLQSVSVLGRGNIGIWLVLVMTLPNIVHHVLKGGAQFYIEVTSYTSCTDLQL